ncbi:MAG: FAD-binding protein [Candidatus Lokiarchaeota archaeon]|nr:FAD-binding protein [Candidatus Lokiarchaeota archaeon]
MQDSKNLKEIKKTNITKKIIEDLEKIVGDSQWVNTDIEILMNYSMDMTEQVAPTLAEVAVMPDSTSEVSQIMKLANRFKIPVIPYAAGANVGGLTLPHEGGIIIDFKRMRRLLQIDKENKFIVVEPGFTFGDLKREFMSGGRLEGFRYSFPFAPPYTSVLTNALLNGLGSLGVKYGCANNFITGLEVVLASGEIVQIGQNAINKGKYWISREPLPDLVGIFVATQGTMGIVTKIGLHLIRQPKYTINYAILPKSADDFLRSWVHELDKLNVCDEIGCGYFPAKIAHGIIPDDDLIELMGKLAGLVRKGNWAKLLRLLGWPLLKAVTFNNPFPLIKFLASKNLLPLPEVGEDEPLMISGITITGETKNIFKAKIKAFKKFTRKQEALVIRPKEFGELAGVFNSILDLPAQLPAFYDLRGGGLTWVGSYIPHTNVADGVAKGHKILKKLGFFPVVVLRPMKQDHYFVMRFIIAFNSSDQKEIANARKAVEKVADVVLESGGTPYKMAPPIAKRIWKKADPSFYDFIAKIKDCVDPNGILNPGKLLVNGTPKNPYKLKDLTGNTGGNE